VVPDAKLGAWEMVEPAEAVEEGSGPVGREALRSDCEDVLRGEFRLVGPPSPSHYGVSETIGLRPIRPS
jgi:hypothetical protein